MGGVEGCVDGPIRLTGPVQFIVKLLDSHNPEHQPIMIDLAKHILHIDGVAVGALIGRLGSATGTE